MAVDVGYLTKAALEAKAAQLLARFASSEKYTLEVPIDLESILHYLQLRYDLDDLETKFGFPDTLGALWIESREIYIDQSLDPDEQPGQLGRFRFTLAHEIGHWELHRSLYEFRQLQDDLFGISSTPAIVCRSSQAKEPIEVQADAFAAALLMPRSEVATHWQRLIDGRKGIRPGAPRNDLIEVAVRPMAEVFEVSAQAMRIRLEGLGCGREVGATASLFEAGE